MEFDGTMKAFAAYIFFYVCLRNERDDIVTENSERGQRGRAGQLSG